MAITVQWRSDNSCVVTRRTGRGEPEVRRVTAAGFLKISEAVAALQTNDMQLYRLVARKKLKTVEVDGEQLFPLSEIRRLLLDRSALYPGRKAPPHVGAA